MFTIYKNKIKSECRMRVNRPPARIPELLDKSAIIMNTRLEIWLMGAFLLKKNIYSSLLH